LIEKSDTQGVTSWFFDMKQPMSSYLVAFAIGNYSSITLFSKSGISLEHYIDRQDTLLMEPTYRYSKELFDFLEAEIGVAYPWQNYKQVPVRDFLYAGMENTGCTLFSQAFVVDSIGFIDRNYVNVNAHELTHQWFGNLVTETSGTHHWLHEGFATYYALLAERELFGDDYYYWKLFQSANNLMTLSEQGKGQSLLDPEASSLIFYEKGAWALHMLRERIGTASFSAAVKSYLIKHQFKNVNTAHFIAEIKAHTKIDVSTWEKDWLQQTAFKSSQAYNSLMASPFMTSYFEIASLAPQAFVDKKIFLETALTFPNDYIGQEAVYQLSREPFTDVFPLYKIAFTSGNLFVRQAIALAQEDSIPKAMQLDFESLLQDPSYVTQETALLKLWRYFPENSARYLDLTKTSMGFQDRNLRQLWLVLAINTDGYQEDKKDSFIKELKEYTRDIYGFEVREIAFDYIETLSLWDLETIGSLLQATTHHYWRFRDIARKHLDTILAQESLRRVVVEAANNATSAAISYLERIGFVIKH
jgi:aminopeptidase N